MLVQIFQCSRKVAGIWRKLHYEEVHDLQYQCHQIEEEDEVIRTCDVHGGDEKHITNFNWKISVEGTTWGS